MRNKKIHGLFDDQFRLKRSVMNRSIFGWSILHESIKLAISNKRNSLRRVNLKISDRFNCPVKFSVIINNKSMKKIKEQITVNLI